MSIRQRITCIVILMFVALSSIGGFAIYRARGSSADVKQVTQGVVPSVLASSDLVAIVKDIQLATMTLVYAPDANLLAQAQSALAAKEIAMRAALEVQRKAAASQVQQSLVDQAHDSMANYFSAIDDTAKAKAAGKQDLAQAELFANVEQYREELEGIVETLRIQKHRQQDAAIVQVNGALATTTAALGAATAVVMLLLVGIGWMLYRQITRPLGVMQAAMSDIAASQDFTRRVPVGRMDEIGRSVVAFNGMIEKIERSAAQLKQKTADIQAMLQNMQQGILTVVDGAVIHPEYSAYLRTIFETDDIAGQPLMALVFGNTDQNADTLAQIDAAVHACLGEDAMNFEFNQHLLANEVNRTMADGRIKTLDLSWSAITNEDDVIVRLMLCVRDVTELRQLAAEASEQKSRLEMIGEILAVGQDKFAQFVESASGFISKNERIITQHAHADRGAVTELFRNMHTIKGNARTYSLRHLTSVAHETEQRYDALRSAETDASWDQEILAADLGRVREMLQRYASLGDTVLGGGNRTGQMAEADREQIRQALHLLAVTDPDDLSALRAMRDGVRRSLANIGTVTVTSALEGVLGSLPSLARDLGKEAPVVRVTDHGRRLPDNLSPVLGDVFMHLLRNALDHGIEPVAERLAHGKPAAGSISIDVSAEPGALQVTLADDGRGLALGRIRAKALEGGWIAPDQAVSDEDLAGLIFLPGFSTAKDVSEVSGRGVGMDAVRGFLAHHRGRVELRFTDARAGAAYRAFQTVVQLRGAWVGEARDAALAAASDALPA